MTDKVLTTEFGSVTIEMSGQRDSAFFVVRSPVPLTARGPQRHPLFVGRTERGGLVISRSGPRLYAVTMTRGGARARSGPLADPQALRRQRDGKDWVRLPSEGRLAPAPEWPLAIYEADEDEMLKWRELWTMPQALIWEADRAHDLVAFYVRTYLEAMKPRASSQQRIFVRSLSADLLLSPDALQRARYVIVGSDEDQAIQAAMADHPAGRGRVPGSSARQRFTVVPNEDQDAPEPIDLDEDEEGDRTAGAKPETDSGEPPF